MLDFSTLWQWMPRAFGFLPGGEHSLQGGLYSSESVRFRRAFHLPETGRSGRRRSRQHGKTVNLVGVLNASGEPSEAQPESRRSLVGSIRLSDTESSERNASADRTIALRRILGRGDGDLCLFDRVDHRNHDAERSTVENSLDQIVIAARDSSQRHTAGICDGGKHHRRHLPVIGECSRSTVSQGIRSWPSNAR